MALTIGQVAQAAGIGLETVRFYERVGLIEDPPRKESGYRQYPEGVVPKLRFIRRSKELGFSLKEIKELLSLRLDKRANCDRVRERSEAKIADIEEKIRTLRRMKQALEKLTTACEARGTTNECPILDALEGNRP